MRQQQRAGSHYRVRGRSACLIYGSAGPGSITYGCWAAAPSPVVPHLAGSHPAGRHQRLWRCHFVGPLTDLPLASPGARPSPGRGRAAPSGQMKDPSRKVKTGLSGQLGAAPSGQGRAAPSGKAAVPRQAAASGLKKGIAAAGSAPSPPPEPAPWQLAGNAPSPSPEPTCERAEDSSPPPEPPAVAARLPGGTPGRRPPCRFFRLHRRWVPVSRL